MANKHIKVQVLLGQKETKANNLITEDMQQFLKPLNFWRNLFLYPTYRIKNNILTNNSKIINITSFIFHVTIILIWFNRLILVMCKANTGITNQMQEFIVNVCKLLSYLIIVIGFIVNYVNSITQRKNNIRLVFELQKMINFIKLDRIHFRQLIIRNWVYGFMNFIQFIVYYLTLNGVLESFTLNFVVDLSLLIFEMNIFYAIRQLILIESILKELRRKMIDRRLTQNNKACSDIYNNFKRMKIVLELYQKVFQDLILFFIVDTLIHALVYVQYWISVLSMIYDLRRSTMVIGTISYNIVRHVAAIVILSVVVEKLKIQIEGTLVDASYRLGNDCSVPETLMLKNIGRLYRSAIAAPSLRGVLLADLSLPLGFLALLTSHIVVILQFSYSYDYLNLNKEK